MESIVEKMLDEFTGVPVKTVKTFMTKTPSVFTGKGGDTWVFYDMIFYCQLKAILKRNIRMGEFSYASLFKSVNLSQVSLASSQVSLNKDFYK